MAHGQGTVFAYSSGATELLAYIFQKDTGQDIEEYAKNTCSHRLALNITTGNLLQKGLPDTEGGLFLRAEDLAKIGYLYLHNGVWGGKQIVSADWVKQSLTPAIDAGDGWKYGFQWGAFAPWQSTAVDVCRARIRRADCASCTGRKSNHGLHRLEHPGQHKLH